MGHKTVRKILSPAVVSAVDGILQSRHEQKEQAKTGQAKNYDLLRPDGDMDVTNREAQAGRRILREDFVRRLQKLNPDLRYEQSKNYPKQGGIYFIGNRHDDVAGTTEYSKWFICGIPHTAINEFSIPLTKEAQVASQFMPIMETQRQVDGLERGWRSVLLKLMREGILTPAAIDREFQITKGRSSRKWQAAVN